jgi:hypothetical protein
LNLCALPLFFQGSVFCLFALDQCNGALATARLAPKRKIIMACNIEKGRADRIGPAILAWAALMFVNCQDPSRHLKNDGDNTTTLSNGSQVNDEAGSFRLMHEPIDLGVNNHEGVSTTGEVNAGVAVNTDTSTTVGGDLRFIITRIELLTPSGRVEDISDAFQRCDANGGILESYRGDLEGSKVIVKGYYSVTNISTNTDVSINVGFGTPIISATAGPIANQTRSLTVLQNKALTEQPYSEPGVQATFTIAGEDLASIQKRCVDLAALINQSMLNTKAQIDAANKAALCFWAVLQKAETVPNSVHLANRHYTRSELDFLLKQLGNGNVNSLGPIYDDFRAEIKQCVDSPVYLKQVFALMALTQSAQLLDKLNSSDTRCPIPRPGVAACNGNFPKSAEQIRRDCSDYQHSGTALPWWFDKDSPTGRFGRVFAPGAGMKLAEWEKLLKITDEQYKKNGRILLKIQDGNGERLLA